jgi:hypothetical protein
MRDEGLRLNLSRSKTGTDSDLLVLCDKNSWLLCPLHALGAMLAVCGATGQRLFPPVSRLRPDGKKSSTASKHVNLLFRKVLEYASSQGHTFAKYVSHALRHGSSAFLNDNVDISTAWIVDRGGKCKQCHHRI